jgi:transposase, IS30 family
MPQPRRPRRSPGPPPLWAQRDLYLQLMAQGMNNSAACRVAGINRRTGTRWRYGRTVTNRAGHQLTYPAITKPATTVSARYLSEDERIVIADRLLAGEAIRAIARQLGRSPSTISRELSRNSDPGSGMYHPFTAQRRAIDRRPRPKPGKLKLNHELCLIVQHHLDKRWSPEQISNKLRKAFPNRPEMHVVPETIYQALYVQGRGELRRELSRALRTGRAHRKPRRHPNTAPPVSSTRWS